MRLLLAEDERDMSNVLTTILKHSGYEVDLAENGQEALDLSMKNNYDCMVMDIMMPVMDGPDSFENPSQQGGRDACHTPYGKV